MNAGARTGMGTASPRGTTPSARNALSALQERLRQRGIWAGALAVPVLGIPVLVTFAQGQQTLEKALWLLAILPVVFLSPLPWQWAGDRSRLNTWKRALPLNLAGGCFGGLLLTAGILALSSPVDAFWTTFLQRIPITGPVTMLVSVGLGWPMANLERLWAQVRAADADAQALCWLSNRSPFPPDLLVRHLRQLSGLAEPEPTATVDGILLLAQLYRTWLGMTELPLVPIETERNLLESFFEAEEHRSGEEIRCSWEGPGGLNSWRLPPFCLFPVCAALLAKGVRQFAFLAQEQADGLELRMHCPRPPGDDPPQASLQAALRLRDILGAQARLEWEDASTLCLFLPRVGP